MKLNTVGMYSSTQMAKQYSKQNIFHVLVNNSSNKISLGSLFFYSYSAMHSKIDWIWIMDARNIHQG